MIIRKVSYTDLDGNKVEETLRFHLSKDELREINANYEGGVKGYLSKLFDNENADEAAKDRDAYKLYEFLKILILNAYGEKSEDARHFVKNDAVRADFESSLAFEALMDDIVDKGDYESFIAGIVGMNADDLEKAKAAALADESVSPSIKKAISESN